MLLHVTAYYSLAKRARIMAGETVLVAGALGQVGRSAMSICHWKKCNTIALVRGAEDVAKAKEEGWNAVDSEGDNLANRILAANQGRSMQVILNSVGNIYWQDFNKILAEFGRIVTISAREDAREASVNLFNLYRANQDILGINTVSLDFQENAKLLNELKNGFEEKKLTPLLVDPALVFSLEKASEAYQAVMKGSAGRRVVIKVT